MKDISLHLMDIVQNSISAKASKIETKISTENYTDELTIAISDNGCGMDEEFLKMVINPFTTTRTTRKVGLGVPMFKDSAEMTGGRFEIHSIKNEGTSLKATFKISNIDRLPLGDIAETMMGVILSSPDIQWILELENDSENFRFDSFEIVEKLGGVPITEFEVISWIKEYIDEGIKHIFGGVLNEITS